MKKRLSILTLALGLSLAQAAPPENYPASRYIDLYRNSPFTDKPEIIDEPDVPNTLVDWTMVGLRKSADSVVVTLLNTKDRNERIRIPSKEATEMGFAIREVKYERNFFESEVVLQKGIHTGKVTFDPKFLVLKAVSGPSTQKGNPPANNPGNNNGRPTPPPTPGGAPPVPGSSPSSNTTAPGNVPIPTPTPRTNPSTNSTSSKSSGRTRYVPRPKK